jgi:biopolymer transport protein ExbD
MAGADLAARPQPKKLEGESLVARKKRRAGIRIDMTPMVDVAFLLLIFFMVTTVFRRPLAMEVNMPEPGAKVEVPESNVMTIFVDEDGSMRQRIGKGTLEPIVWEDLPEVFRQLVAANPDLIVLVKLHRTARYERMVDMMDALDEAHMERFSLIAMTEAEMADASLSAGAGSAGTTEAPR